MPHKHKRKRENDKDHYDLPPTKLAKSLPSYEKVEKKHHKPQKGSAKPKPKRTSDATKIYREDDTPRAFARMMHLQQANKKQRNGLDDGIKRTTKKSKPSSTATTTTDSAAAEAADHATVLSTASTLKILPGERLSDFAARVNQALPLSNIPTHRSSKTAHAAGDVKARQTKTEKRLQKMYAEWRAADAARKEKEEEFLELQESKDEELQNELGGQAIHLSAEGKRTKRKRMLTEAKDTGGKDDDDPWKVLEEKREKPRGLHDVVQAPPELKAVKEKFKVRNGAKVEVQNVPGKSGSLKRREELGQARNDVIERYRAMMKGKGGI